MLFVAISAALVAAAVALRHPPDSGAPSSRVQAAQADGNSVGAAHGVVARLDRRQAGVRVAAGRFLTAFLRYEVGDLSAPVRRALRAGATRPFADRLLSHPPRPPAAGRFPPRATLRRIDIAFVSPLATRAVVSGSALRDGLPEEFSFLLVRRRQTWLASGPGE
jgi:hypothetical protein